MTMKNNFSLTVFSLLMAATASAQQTVARFDMSLSDGKITEQHSGAAYEVVSQLPACTAQGLDGDALRFDGYSNYVKAALPEGRLSTEALTVSVVLAAETYPMMKVDVAEDQPSFATVCGNLEGKEGFALQLSSQGDLRFQFGSAYANGYLFTINSSERLPRGQWCQVVAVLDKAANSAKLYLNGSEVGSSRMSRANMVHSKSAFFIGKDASELKSGPFLINTFCGLIDDISISNEAVAPQAFGSTPRPDFTYPAARYAGNPWRPQFHGMPSGSWTNESHGMLYSNGRYHLFFQKNANGPYMSRLHWGHISSANLYQWREEPIAVAPGESYDLKGCWSGCVYEDEGTPYLLYTAVDNARATIAGARALDADLAQWQKTGIAVNGRPAGLSDDFRDPCFFTAGGQKYVVVGTSKNGVGACTLHRYEGGSWTNDGSIFFQGSTASLHGTFWEMPTVTPMSGGKWLFTCTPLGTAAGVRTLCWVGTIGSDGKFQPDANGVQYLEMGGISRDGYGLLSPTVCPLPSLLGEGAGERLLLMGIVPDKLPTQANYDMGWAHNFSLPREVSLDASGLLVQRPYSGLQAMRTQTAASLVATLDGAEQLAPVSGLQLELLGEFTIAAGQCGFRFMKSANGQASLTYDPERGTLTLDLSQLSRTANDAGSYNGVYSATLPRKVNAGEKLKLHVFVDGSIVDIFVCDTWAFSVRVFPTDAAQTEVEVFATSTTQASVNAWTLDARQSPDTAVEPLRLQPSTPGDHTAYDLCGRKVQNPRKGFYIRNGKKYVAR